MCMTLTLSSSSPASCSLAKSAPDMSSKRRAALSTRSHASAWLTSRGRSSNVLIYDSLSMWPLTPTLAAGSDKDNDRRMVIHFRLVTAQPVAGAADRREL
jgi:hypothetical protein